MSEIINIFNRQSVRHHRERAASSYADFDFLFQETAERLGDRLKDITRTFPITLDLGCHDGDMAAHIPVRSDVKTLINSDLSSSMAAMARNKNRVIC